jgi:hypothetical protein
VATQTPVTVRPRVAGQALADARRVGALQLDGAPSVASAWPAVVAAQCRAPVEVQAAFALVPFLFY